MKRTALLLGVAGLVALGGCMESRYRTYWKNKAAPDFQLNDLSGQSVRLSDFRGKPVLLAFWAHG